MGYQLPGEISGTLSAEIKNDYGVDFKTCFQCKSCTNACPFLEGMDVHPNAILRMIQFGMEEQVLETSTIWVCVGCNTCCVHCPMAIDIPAVMDSLRQRAIQKGAKIAEPDIYNFHKEVLRTLEKYGRTHKLEIMMRYKLTKMDLFSDLGVGLQMLKKRKLDLAPSRVKAKDAIAKIFSK